MLDEEVCNTCKGEQRILDFRYKPGSINHKVKDCWTCQGRGKTLTEVGEKQLQTLLFYFMDYFPLRKDV